MILVPLFDLKFLTEVAAGGCRNFKSAALVRLQVILVILVPKCCLFATVAGPIRVGEGAISSRRRRRSARHTKVRIV